MAKNQIHCIRCLSVLMFPRIVVQLESGLKPECVFYVLPFHTIHLLLQLHGSVQNQNSLTKPCDHHDCSCDTSLVVDSNGLGGEVSCLFGQSMKSKSQKNKLSSTTCARLCGEVLLVKESLAEPEINNFHFRAKRRKLQLQRFLCWLECWIQI